MKKKGFTLIELLAVILILGIIALIAIPTVTKIIETAKKNSLKVSASGVLEAGNYYYATNGKDIEDEIVFTCSGNKCTNGDKVVNYSGNVENGILVIKKNGDMGICINSGKYYASKDIETDNINSGKGYCDNYEDGTFVVSGSLEISENAKYKDIVDSLIAAKSIVWNYNYVSGTNKEQFLDIPADGTYKLEVWGAQGGSINNNNVNLTGGYGGYSVGNIDLKGETRIYINVGGQGVVTGTTMNERASGGYNGGGNGYNSNWATSRIATSGGGATHIALQSGVLSSLSAYKGEYSDELETYLSNDILIVAGGGGGTWYVGGGWNAISSGSGGGYIGGTGKSLADSVEHTKAGGTQSSGGGFGKGQSATTGEWGGGGGGFYGGYLDYGASGGSGYIGNPSLTNKVMYCYSCSQSNKESIKNNIYK